MSYPAPSNLKVTNKTKLSWDHTSTDFVIEIHNFEGRKLFREEIVGAKSIDLDHPSRTRLKPGLYTARVAAKDPSGGTGTPPSPDYGDWVTIPLHINEGVNESLKKGVLQALPYLGIALIVSVLIGGIIWWVNRGTKVDEVNDDPPISGLLTNVINKGSGSGGGSGSQITTFGDIGNSNVINVQSIINNYNHRDDSKERSLWPTNTPPSTNIILRQNVNARVGDESVEILEFVLKYGEDAEFFVPQGWRAQPGFDPFERRPDYAIDGIPVTGLPTGSGFTNGETFRIRNRKDDKGPLKVYVKLERRSSARFFTS